MKRLLTAKRLFCILFLTCSPMVFGQAGAPSAGGTKITKVEIKHIGPPATSDALIKANIRVKESDPYQRARVDDDVRNLHATGFFYNIRVAEDYAADGVKLTYVLQGNPLLTDIKFTGNKKYSNRKLLKKVTSKTGKPLDERKLFTDSQELQKMYQKVGYQKTTVKSVLNIDETTGRGTVTFEIVEGGKVKIQDIIFEGANSFEQKKLRKALKTKRHWMFSWLTGSNVLKDDQFEDDKDKLIEFYQNEGYIDFQIKEVKFDYTTPKKLDIRFVVSEGKQYKIGNISFKGNTLFNTNDILKGVGVDGKIIRPQMLVDKTFTPKGLTRDVDAINDFYGSKGYIDARIMAGKNANVTTGTMDVVYEITEGEKAFIEKIEIKGNEKTKDRVIRRELAVYPGEVYDTTRVKLSKNRLEGLNYFEKVDTQSEDTDVPNRKNLVVGVEEKNTGNFTIGAGLSSVDSVVGFVEVSQSNFDLFKAPTFTGAGQKFRLRLQIGNERKDIRISFIEPWFLGRKLAFGVDLFHSELNYLSDLYDQTETGGTLSLTRALGSDFLIGKVSYTFENIGVNIDDPSAVSPELLAEDGDRLVSKFGTSLAYDTRNSGINPTRGQRTEFLTELAGPFGGETDFYKVEVKTDWFFPGFFEGHLWEIVGQTGVADNYGRSSRVPIFDRWFLGGLYSLRGYKYRQVGPRILTGPSVNEPIGGNTYWFGSVEYSLPIIERLRFALFYDIGNVYANTFSFDRQPGQEFYNDNWGIGLRINLPMLGSLRLDYGIPITHDTANGSSGRFQFGVGTSRPF